MQRKSSSLLLIVAIGSVLTWAASLDGGRLLDTHAYVLDTERSAGNTFRAGEVDAPSLLTTSANGTVELDWSAPSGGSVDAAGQRVMRATSTCPGAGLPVGASQVGSDLSATATDFEDTTVTGGQTYCYYIQSFLASWTAHTNTAEASPSGGLSYTAILLPELDKVVGGGPLNQWQNDDDDACVAATSTCAARIADASQATYVYHGSLSATVSFDLTGGPSGLAVATQARVKYEAREDSSPCDLTVGLYKSSGPPALGEETETGLTGSFVTYDLLITGLNLSASDVDGLYVEIENAGAGECEVAKISVEVVYATTALLSQCPDSLASYDNVFIMTAPGSQDGTNDRDIVVGTTGIDDIDAKDDDDCVLAGDGADDVSGGLGADYIDGGDGDNDIEGGGGDTIRTGSGADDICTGTFGTFGDMATCGAGTGDNVIEAAGGNNQIVSGSGADKICAGTFGTLGTMSTCATASGNNTIASGDGVDEVRTGSGADTICGGSFGTFGAIDTCSGGSGGKTVRAGTGSDDISTGSGADQVFGQGGNDDIETGGGGDTIETGSGNDDVCTGTFGTFGDASTCSGAGVFADTVTDSGGNNYVSTLDGADDVTTGAGDDSIDCGPGTDTADADGGTNTNVGGSCETFS